ncbi:MAG: AMMECR1 domain-containing protein, partial [Candidatus Binatia bacterium]
APPSPLPVEASRQRACYVSMYENPGRRLRFMHGSPLPRHRSLAEEVIMNTVEAIKRGASQGLRPIDLSYFSYGVAVLGPLERISSPAHLNPSFFGLYIRSDRNKSAIILPQRTGIETSEDQIATALREADIDANREGVTMYRFGVEYHDEKVR